MTLEFLFILKNNNSLLVNEINMYYMLQVFVTGNSVPIGKS